MIDNCTRTLSVLALLIVIVALASCDKIRYQDSKVSGYILDKSTFEPVGNANVWLYTLDEVGHFDAIKKLKSDKHGLFKIEYERRKGKEYHLIASRTCYPGTYLHDDPPNKFREIPKEKSVFENYLVIPTTILEVRLKSVSPSNDDETLYTKVVNFDTWEETISSKDAVFYYGVDCRSDIEVHVLILEEWTVNEVDCDGSDTTRFLFEY